MEWLNEDCNVKFSCYLKYKTNSLYDLPFWLTLEMPRGKKYMKLHLGIQPNMTKHRKSYEFQW